jgi:hypothetical protein
MHYICILFRSINKESITALISLIKRNHVSFGIGFNITTSQKRNCIGKEKGFMNF